MSSKEPTYTPLNVPLVVLRRTTLPPASVTLMAVASGVCAFTASQGQLHTLVSRMVLSSTTLSAEVERRILTPSFMWWIWFLRIQARDVSRTSTPTPLYSAEPVAQAATRRMRVGCSMP